MESKDTLIDKVALIFSRPPKENLASEKTKLCFSALRELSTAMNYNVSCDPDVVQIIGSDYCVNYFVDSVRLIIDELTNCAANQFKEPLVVNFITLYAVLWNVTDKSCDVCNRFVLADAYESIWHFISKDELSSAFHTYINARLLVHCSLGILHNLLRYCPQARDGYRACGGVKILDPYIVGSEENECDLLISLKTAALFTLAAIVNENENVSIITTDQGVLTYILSALSDSLQSPPDYFSTTYGYHAAEVFGCLSCLASINSNKVNIFENNALELISTALQISLRVKNGSLKMAFKTSTGSRDYCRFSEDVLAKEAIDLLWHLSCLSEAREQLKETSDLYKLCSQFNDVKWTAECRKSVQALLCTLSQQRNWLDECGNLDTSAITASPKPRGHVMISYNNRSQGLVSKLKEALALRGWKVWIFTEHCQHGSFLEQMAQAVFDSSALIVCLSSFYNTSCHCIKEVISAYEYRIPLLPVVTEVDYIPINFLRFLLTGMQLIQYYNVTQVCDVADKLTEQLRCYGVMREGINVIQSRPSTNCAAPIDLLPSVPYSTTKGHQRSCSDSLTGTFRNRQLPESVQPSISMVHSAAIPERLVLPPASWSPRTQRPDSAYFFNSTPHIDVAPPSGSSTSNILMQLPAPLEAYLVEQIPSKVVRGWREEQVRQWLAEHSLVHYANTFAHINGNQLYELAWQRIRGCDSFFRNLSFSMHMPLYEQLLLSSALAGLHNYQNSPSPPP